MANLDLPSVAAQCAPAVDPLTLRALYTVESSGNPYAIGVVGGWLQRQPRTLAEAISTANELKRRRIRFSAGVAQIYVANWPVLGLESASVFDPCANLRSAATVLKACYQRAAGRAQHSQHRLRLALSCYYSGNFTTGFADGYVRKVTTAAAQLGAAAP